MTKAAGQVIAQVRAEGVSDALPGPTEFDSTSTHLGAAYEAACARPQPGTRSFHIERDSPRYTDFRAGATGAAISKNV